MTLLQFCVISFLTILSFVHCNTYTTPNSNNCAPANEARDFLEHENELLRQREHKYMLALFNFQINLTNFNSELVANISLENAIANNDLAKRIFRAGYDKINDEFIKRQAKAMVKIGTSIPAQDDFNTLTESIQNMTSNYAIHSKENYGNNNETMSGKNKSNIGELAYFWTERHNAVGTPMRDNFRTYVELSNKVARMNNYNSNAEYWVQQYEDNSFETNIDAAYEAIYPLYKELHGYLRHHLRKQYGNDVVSPNGNIPDHLQTKFKKNIDLYLPFPKKPVFNITVELLRQGFNLTRITEYADQFFTSLNMHPLPESFWKLSILERQPNVTMNCHPTAWDMKKDSDVRITMCGKVNAYAWWVIHHELGHNQYQLQYGGQPTIFRNAPHPGFHEAIGELILLSVDSQRHLKEIGFVTEGVLDEESRINKLFQTALETFTSLPFFYSVDKWRFQVFRNKIDESIWNCAYWIYRSKYSGIEPAVKRTDNDFDPPAVYHVNIDMNLLRYFTARIFKFQFHKALCLKAGQYKPNSTDFTLDNCDIYNNEQAGEALAKFLSLGSSKHWKEALEGLTGETTLDTTAILEYFQPLHEWLQRENKRLNVTSGWRITDKVTCNYPL